MPQNHEEPPIEGVEIPMTREEADNYMWEEAMVASTLTHRAARNTLIAEGLVPIGEGEAPLDALASLLDSRDQLSEPGQLLSSTEATLTSKGSSPIYFLDLRPQGPPPLRDWCIVDNIPLVHDSLVRARLSQCAWDEPLRDGATTSAVAANFKHIAGLLGVPYADILASYFIFARSRRFRASRTVWEQIDDCLPAHKLMIDIAKPEVLWVAGADPELLEKTSYPLLVTWKTIGKTEARVGRGKFKFCGRMLHTCITPDLATWDATSEEHQDALAWAFEGVTQ